MVDRVGADHEAHRQRLAGGGARLVDRAQVAGRDQVDAGLPAAAQHQAAHADIGPAGLGVDHEIDRGGDIGPAVGAVPEMHGQLGEIGVVAGEHDLLRRRLARAAPRRCPACCAGGAAPPASSALGATPNARASRVRLPVTLPTSSWRSGPTARNSTAFGLPSSTRRDVGEIDRLAARSRARRLAARLSTKRRSRKRSKSAAGDGAFADDFCLRSFRSMAMAVCSAAADYSGKGCPDHQPTGAANWQCARGLR